MTPAIRVRGLGKRYQLGSRAAAYATIRESISGAMASLLRRNSRSRAPSRSVWALEDVTFDVMPGEVVGIVGRNGAGKSTLLKILSRITEPTTGRAELVGRVGSLLEVGTGFHPELTGRENVYLSGAILGMSRREVGTKLDQIIEFAEVRPFLDTPVKRYSSGMYARLAFAVAAHLETEILLVDEVLAVGDIRFQNKCLSRMDTAVKEGRTVLFVSHNMSAVASLCTRGLCLEGGRIAREGAIRDVVDYYLRQASLSEAKFDGQPVTRATVRQYDDELEICAEYAVEQPLSLPCLGFVLSDAMGNPLFGSNPRVDGLSSQESPRRAGAVTVRIRAPRLLEGTYRVSLWFGDGHQDFFHQRDCLVLQVVPTLHRSVMPRITGPIVPECVWRFD